MAPVFNQALMTGYVGFVTETYTQCISSRLLSVTNILACFVQQWCMQQPSECQQHWPKYGGEIYSNTLFNRL